MNAVFPQVGSRWKCDSTKGTIVWEVIAVRPAPHGDNTYFAMKVVENSRIDQKHGYTLGFEHEVELRWFELRGIRVG